MNQTGLLEDLPVSIKPTPAQGTHRWFVLFMILYALFSLFTLRDIPGVDATNDDMWNMDWTLTFLQTGHAHQTVNIIPEINQVALPFNLSTALNAVAFSVSPDIFALRAKSTLIGLVLLACLYFFSCPFFADRRMALLATVSLAFTYGFLRRSHDSRTEIFAALLFFLTFWQCYRLIMATETREALGSLFWLGFLPMLCFRQVHMNGIIFYPVAFCTILAFRRGELARIKSWLVFAAGAVVCFIYDMVVRRIVDAIHPPPQQQALHFSYSDYFDVIPVFQAVHVTSVGSFAKSIGHVFGLVFKFPVRMLGRIDAGSMARNIDIVLIALSIAAALYLLIAPSASRKGKIVACWLFAHLVFMALFSGAASDYASYLLPISILLVMTAMLQLLGGRGRITWQRVLVPALVVQVGVICFAVIKLKYVERYADHLAALTDASSRLIVPGKSVIGAPVYFTMLEPKGHYDYKEIFQVAAPANPVMKPYFEQAHYDFLQEFRQKKFDYVIFDDFFISCLPRAGFTAGGEAFIQQFMSDYQLVADMSTTYPSHLGPIKRVRIYKRIG